MRAAFLAAVVDHGWKEVRQRGNFDPEVLTVVYLVTSMLRGNSLPATLFTWATAFGRHLLKRPGVSMELRPMAVSQGAGGPAAANGTPRYEVVVSPKPITPDHAKLLDLVPTALKYAMGQGPGGQGGHLIDELRTVSKLHGEVLEGLGEFREGIPVRFKRPGRH